MALAYGVVSAASSNTALSYGVIVTPQPYRPLRLFAGDGSDVAIIEDTFGYSNTTPMVFNPFTDKTKQDSIVQSSTEQNKLPAPVQVLNTALSTVTGAGGAESWIS